MWKLVLALTPLDSVAGASLRYDCKLQPIVDVAGHTPAEVEEQLGAERAWAEEDTSFGFGAEVDISEGREREFDMLEAGADQEMIDSMERTVIEPEEGGLFAEISQVEEGRRRTIGGKPIQVVSEMETPDLEAPESQFEVLREEVDLTKTQRPTIERRSVNKHTEIFRRSERTRQPPCVMLLAPGRTTTPLTRACLVLFLLSRCSELEKKFARLARQGASMQIEFDDFLTELLQGSPNRRDRALAFYQLLVLASLEVIRVRQDVSMGAIAITKGVKYTVRWR